METNGSNQQQFTCTSVIKGIRLRNYDFSTFQDLFDTEAEQGQSKNILPIRKKYFKLMSFRQIACEKFGKSRKQFQIVV